MQYVETNKEIQLAHNHNNQISRRLGNDIIICIISIIKVSTIQTTTFPIQYCWKGGTVHVSSAVVAIEGMDGSLVC